MLLFDFVSCMLVAFQGGAPLQAVGQPVALERLWALTSDGGSTGAVVTVQGGPPWRAEPLAPTDGGLLLRRFGRSLFAVNSAAGTIRRIPLGAGSPQDYDIGASSEPQDIHVHSPAMQLAARGYVTRRNDPFLLQLDLATGKAENIVDLSPVGGGAPITLGTMERDGSRLFVQVGIGFCGSLAPLPSGVLAVVDLVQKVLIDVEPGTPGIQGIALQGASPRLKMQILGRTLFVSTTDSFLDECGGIEMVDLDLLASTGFALSEAQVGADVGGFVMTAPDEGYFVFHTDIIASTHLKHFTIPDGPDPGVEIVVLLNDTVEVIAHDPLLGRIFLPSGFAWGEQGLYVVSTQTNELLGPPVDTLGMPHDVLVAR